MLSWALSAVSRTDPNSKRNPLALHDSDSAPPSTSHGHGKHALGEELVRTSGVHLDEPGLSSIFNAAALYEQIIDSSPDCYKHIQRSRDPDRSGSKLGGIPEDEGRANDGTTKEGGGEKTAGRATAGSLRGFADLVGRDLTPHERALSGRIAQISVNNWSQADGILEPESDDADDVLSSTEVSEEDGPESKEKKERAEGQDGRVPPPERIDEAFAVAATDDEEKLTPEEVVRLLVEEFGPLAEEGEERLVLETDAALVRDVVVLGVAHLTTHRLTFHASLLSSSPDNLSSQIIKAGPVLIHRKGWRRKRRLWLELSHDMLSSFPSSREEDRIKPIRSILLSSIVQVMPQDPKHEKVIHIMFDAAVGFREGVIEFDTEESARDWRKEIQGAIYLYRRNARNALRPSHHKPHNVHDASPTEEDADTNGIRINIPLHRIESMSSEDCLTFATIYRIGFSTASSSARSSTSAAPAPAALSTGGAGSGANSSAASSMSPSESADSEELGSGTEVFVDTDTAPSSVELEVGGAEVHEVQHQRSRHHLVSGETDGETSEAETDDAETDEEVDVEEVEDRTRAAGSKDAGDKEEEDIDVEATPIPPSLPPPTSLKSALKKWDKFCAPSTQGVRKRTRRRVGVDDVPPEERAPTTTTATARRTRASFLPENGFRRTSFSPVRSPFGKFEFDFGLRSPRQEVGELGTGAEEEAPTPVAPHAPQVDFTPTPTEAQPELLTTTPTSAQTSPAINKRSSFMKFDFSLRSPRTQANELPSDEHEHVHAPNATSTPDDAQTQTATAPAQTPLTNANVKSPFRKFEFTLPSLPPLRSSKSGSPRTPPSELPGSEDPPSSASNSRPLFDSPQSASSLDPLNGTMYEPAPVHQTLNLTVIRNDPKWALVSELARKARERVAAGLEDEERWAGSRVYVDYEPGSYYEAKAEQSEFVEMLSDVERGVAGALALDPKKEMWVQKAHVHRRLGCYFGYFVITPDCVGFWSKSFTLSNDVRYRLPLRTINTAKVYRNAHMFSYGLTLELSGQSDVRFWFQSEAVRDEALNKVGEMVKSRDGRVVEHAELPLLPLETGLARTSSPAVMAPSEELGLRQPLRSPSTSRPPSRGSDANLSRASSGVELATAATNVEPFPSSTTTSSLNTPVHAHTHSDDTGIVHPSHRPVKRSTTSILAPLGRTKSHRSNIPHVLRSFLPKTINVPSRTLLKMPSLHFVCLTIGSRGDVQPYIALALGLQKEGHRVTIVTHEEYKEWVEKFGVAHRTAGGDPGALMKLSVENKMFSPQFFKESIGNFRTWLDELLVDAWECCKDADVLLESPSAMAGVHIAEALHIPYFRTFTMPWTKTRQFPHPFLSPPVESPAFNATSYVLFDNVLWTATSSQINRWRRNTLQIASTDMGHLAQSKIPFVYNFSSSVVPKPLDWGDATSISGYWFLDNPDHDWAPSEELLAWMRKAREDGKKIVYIGFGSIVVPNPRVMTRNIIKAVVKSGVRAIVSKGWSARMVDASKKAEGEEEEIVFPEECFSVDKIPHDWLFPQIDAALHHGGAGTTGASLRAGIPTLIRPWFGDQFFWASRVHKLGAGLKVSSLRVGELSDALVKATTDRVMKEKAARVGERIREEDGVQNAIHAIYTYLPRAARDRQSLD